MKRIFLGVLLITGLLNAQNSWVNYLLMTNDSLQNNPVYAETILDAVQPIVKDTTFWPETQRLRLVFGDVLEGLLGLRWEAIHLKRTKLIGQNVKEVAPYDGPFTREYDINFYIVPHLPNYVDSVSSWWARAGEEGRNLFHSFSKNPAITIPEKLTLGNWFLFIECENTPIKSLRTSIDSLFIPCIKASKGLQQHSAFGYLHPTMGFYGPAAMDCNHSCKPEIHPYEWIWWLKPDNTPSTEKIWYVGLHRDWSGRFRDWSTSPRIGKIKIPFLLKANGSMQMKIELLNYDEFVTQNHEDYLNKGMWMPTADFRTGVTDEIEIKMEVKNFPNKSVKINFTGIEKINIDGNDYVKGYVELGMAVKNLAEIRLTYDPAN